jgi:DNA-binding beta-propeller fold protein YncE
VCGEPKTRAILTAPAHWFGDAKLETTVKKHLLALLGMALVALAPHSLAQSPVPEIPFDSVPDFLKLPPDMNLGEAAGVAVNSKGHVFVFTRSNSASGPAYAATAAQLLEFDQTGKFIREIGKGLYAWSYAHAIRFDKDDNLWAIDKGSDMIVRFNPEGHVTMVFGRKKEASEKAEPWEKVNPPLPPIPGQFRQPTDVAWDADGNIYISDGYVNSRVAKFDKNGDWVTSIGEPGRTKLGEINTAHSIAADAKGNIYVADRGNRRIQVIDPKTNKFVREIRIDVPVPPDAHPWMGAQPAGDAGLMQGGAPWAICITPGPTQYLYAADAFPGRVYKLTLDGKVVGWLGKTGHQLKQFGWIHEIACPSENELYVGELLNWRVQKLILHP